MQQPVNRLEAHSGIRPVAEFPGYGVSADGRVWSARSGAWLPLALHGDGSGYLKVKLYVNGMCFQVKAHVLVARVFLGPCPDGHEVNHKDGAKTHNAVSNLEYLTHSDNGKHAHAMGLISPPYTHTPRPVRLLIRA